MPNPSTNVPANARRRSTSAWLLALTIASAGCALDTDEPSSDGDETITLKEPLFEQIGVERWTVVGGHIPVCFDGTVPDALRTQVRDAITNSWMRVANLDFNGFGNCPVQMAGKVKVIVNTGLGALGDTSPAGYPGANSSSLVQFGSDTPSQKTIIHEFGHVLGFIHEHLDNNPLTCTQRMNGTGFQLSPFDLPSSIMSQTACNSAQVLSPLDIMGVQRAYGERLTGSAVGLNSQCVDVPPGAPAGTTVRYSHCTSGSNQRFRRTTNRHLFIPSLANSFLDVRGGALVNHAVVQTFFQHTPPSNIENQQFSFDRVAVVGVGNKCADVPGFAFFPGTQLQIFTCNGGINQKWTVLPDGVVMNGDFCWDVPGGQTANGTILQIFGCNGGNNQKFVFTPSGQMTFGGKCVDVQNGLPNDGAKLQLFTCKAANDSSRFNQRFHLTGPINVGPFFNVGNPVCLDIPGANTADNVTAQVFACHGGANQIWDFYPGF
jgi:ricin-type beta-trefoil lectin protein